MVVLASAREHYLRQRNLTVLALAAARRAEGNPARLAALVTAFQLLAATDAAESVGLMLAEQNITADPEAAVNVTALAGVASDGRPLDSLMGIDFTPHQLGLVVATQVQDAARQAASVSIASRPRVSGYVRMLNTPSCSRCIVLAGKRYRWNAGFRRHPRCDCRHIPTAEDVAGDLTSDSADYFNSLTATEQDRIFTKAGAESIRLGADMSQVANVRSGMYTAQLGAKGEDLLFTRTGTTSRAWYGGGYGGSTPGELTTREGLRYKRSTRPRAMPETIMQIAGDDRNEALRLLRLNGYLM